jgi:drug/metabolite transporter (DMT)-like permease
MTLGLLAALGAALGFAAGSVLQEVGARRTKGSTGLDPRVLLRVLGQLPFLIGIVLDFAGFLLQLVALRSLPIFVVQAVVASSVGFTAVLARLFLGARLGRAQVVPLVGIGIGLGLVALSAASEHPRHISTTAAWAFAAGAIPLALAATVVARGTGERAAARLGFLSGIAFGGTAIASRVAVIPRHHLMQVLSEPELWALVAFGLLGFLVFTTALQRGSVTTATATMWSAEALVPAAVGIAFLGDHARRGTAPMAAVGFLLAIGATVGLASRQVAEVGTRH